MFPVRMPKPWRTHEDLLSCIHSAQYAPGENAVQLTAAITHEGDWYVARSWPS